MTKKSVMSETPRRSRITTSFALCSRQIRAARWARTDEESEVVVFISVLGAPVVVEGSDARVGLLSIMLGDEPQNGLSHITAIDELSDIRPRTSMASNWGQKPGRGAAKGPEHFARGLVRRYRRLSEPYCLMTHTRISGFTSACSRTGTR